MTKRIVPILIILILICCILTACNTSVNENATAGITISGRIIFDNQPLSNVKVFHGDNVAYSNEYGIFVLSNLDKQDVVYFVLDDYDFNPDKIVVTKNVYDLEIVATKTQKPSGENQDNPTENQPTDNDNETGGNDDNPSDKPTDEDKPTTPTEENPEQGENQDDEITPNCTNGALIIQNSTIKFMFCVDNDFSALVFSTLKNDVETVIEPAYSKEKDVVLDGKTLQLYCADVSSFVDANEIEFVVKASNKNFTTGTVAIATYYPPISTINPTLSQSGNMLLWTAVEDDASYKILVNGVIISSTTETSFDLSSLELPTEYTIQIRAKYKNGVVTYSNVIEISAEQ